LSTSIVRLVETGTWRILANFQIRGNIRDIAITPDGKGVAVSVFTTNETGNSDPWLSPPGDIFLYEEIENVDGGDVVWNEHHIPAPCTHCTNSRELPCEQSLVEACGSIDNGDYPTKRNEVGFSFGSSLSILNDFKGIFVGSCPFPGDACNGLDPCDSGIYFITTRRKSETVRTFKCFPVNVGKTIAEYPVPQTHTDDHFRMCLTSMSKEPNSDGFYVGAYSDGVGGLHIWKDIDINNFSTSCNVIHENINEDYHYIQPDSSNQQLIPSVVAVSGNGRFVA